MLKEKRSFFEKLTGTSSNDYAEENNYNLPNENDLESENEVIIQSIVAGVKSEDLDISIDKNSVSIRGRRERNRLTDRETPLCQELYWGGFSRSVSLSDEIDPENAEAVTKNGILTIRLPLVRKTQIKKLRVVEE